MALRRRFQRATGAVLAALTLAVTPKAQAIIFYWLDAGADVNSVASWFSIEGAGGPPGAGDIGSFILASYSNQPQLTVDRAIGGLSLGSGAGALNFGASSGGVKTLTVGSVGLFNSSSNGFSLDNGNLAVALGANTSFSTFTAGATILIGSSLNSFDLGGNVLTLGGVGTGSTIAKGIAAGSGGIIKSGSGTWTLSATNLYTGGTNIDAGTLVVSAANALGSSGAISFGGGTLQFSGVASTTDYSSRFSTAAGQQFKFNTNGESVTFATALSSSGATLSKSGGGTLSLNATNNDASGGTTVSGGVLRFSAAGNSLGAVMINAGGTLQIGANNALASTSSMTLNGGMLQIFGGGFTQHFGSTPLSITAASVIDFGSGLGASALTFAASDTQSWSGSLTISNYSTAGGDTLRFGNSGSGLTGAQLTLINFDGVAAQIDSSGFVTPVPESAWFALVAGLGVCCRLAVARSRAGKSKVEAVRL